MIDWNGKCPIMVLLAITMAGIRLGLHSAPRVPYGRSMAPDASNHPAVRIYPGLVVPCAVDC